MRKQEQRDTNSRTRWPWWLLAAVIVFAAPATVVLITQDVTPQPSVAAGPATPSVSGTESAVNHVAQFNQPQTKKENQQQFPAPVRKRPDAGSDPSVRNPGIDPLSLNVTDLKSTKEFLSEVTLKRHPDGGFVVQEVDSGSLYEKLGLRPGDIVHNMDVFAKYGSDANARMAGIYAGDAELQVIRDGAVVILRTRPE